MPFTVNKFPASSVHPRYVMFGAKRPIIDLVIGHSGLGQSLKISFMAAAFGDEHFSGMIRSALLSPLGKSEELDCLHSRFGQGARPDSYQLAHMIKKHGLMKSLEFPEIRKLFLQHTPDQLISDPRMKLILDDRSLYSILKDPQMRGSADAFWKFMESFDIERFLEEPSRQVIIKETSKYRRMEYYDNLIASMNCQGSRD